ncbi:transcriptional regulator, partial [Acinetobacter baumannii]
MGTKNVKVPTLTERVRRGDLFTGENNCQSREAFAHVTSLWGV